MVLAPDMAAMDVDQALLYMGDYRRRITDNLFITPKAGGAKIPLTPSAIQNEFLDYTLYSPWIHHPSPGQILPTSPWTAAPFSFRNLILKPRQIGMSTIVLARHILAVATEENVNLAIIAQDDAFRDEFRERTHAYLEQLTDAGECPKYGTSAGAGKMDNKDRLDFEHGSTIYFQSAQSPNIGRTVTFHRVYGTEVAFWDASAPGTARKILHAFLASVPPPPFGTIDLESTPNGPAGAFYEMCTAASEGRITDIGGGYNWKLFFWPWWAQAEYTDPTPDIKLGKLEDHETFLMYDVDGPRLSSNQISWRRAQKAQAEALRKEFDSEYPEDPITCFTSAQRGVVPHHIVAKMRAWAARADNQPIRTELNGDLRIYVGPEPGAAYILGADGAHGNPGDDESALVICRKDSMDPVAVYNGYMPIHDFAKLCARLGYEYNTAYLAAESNNDVGYALNNAIDDLRYPNMHTRQNLEANLTSSRNVNPFAFGWQTNVKTRADMVGLLQDYLIGALIHIRDRVLVDQVATFIWAAPRGNVNGRKRAEAGPAAKDDLLFALMICLVVRDYATDTSARGRPVRK